MHYHQQLSVVGTGPLCAALSGLCATLTLNPGLTPWAILLDPFGVPSFAPETSYKGKSLPRKEKSSASCIGAAVGHNQNQCSGIVETARRAVSTEVWKL